MAVRFFRLFKQLPYRTGAEPVMNVYMNDGWSAEGAGTDTPTAIRDIEGKLLEMERSIHGSNVLFLRVESGLVRPPRGAEKYPVPGQVDYEREYPANTRGSLSGTQNEPSEWTQMVQQRISKRGWLRKYFHRCTGSLTVSPNQLDPWLWGPGVAAAALAAIKGVTALTETANPAGEHWLCNSRGTRANVDLWTAPERAVFHEMKY